MSGSGPPPTPPDYIQLLDGIVHAGVKLVHKTCDNPPAPGQNRANDYAALTKSNRQSIMLIDRRARNARRPAADPATRTAARKQILRAAQDAIQNRAHGPNAESLRAELLERLDDPELAEAIDTRPIADIIADILRDLPVVANDPGRFQRRSPDDIRVLGILAATPSGQTAAQAALILPTDPAGDPEPPPLPNRPDHAVSTILRYEALLRDQR